MHKNIRMMGMMAALGVAAAGLAGCQTQKAKPMHHVMPAPAPVVEQIHQSLSADAMFAFGKADIDSLSDEGRNQLDTLVQKLQAAKKVTSVELIGYTDRIGSETYNQQLSEQRAAAVGGYLSAHGVPAEVIHTEGRGEANPVSDCGKIKGRKLRACLAPDRRVEVNIVTEQ